MTRDKYLDMMEQLGKEPLEKEIPIIINIIPPALNRPKPAEIGSSPKKFNPIIERIYIIGSIKKASASSFT